MKEQGTKTTDGQGIVYSNGTAFKHKPWMGEMKYASEDEKCFIVYQDLDIHDIECSGHEKVVGLCQIRCPGDEIYIWFDLKHMYGICMFQIFALWKVCHIRLLM